MLLAADRSRPQHNLIIIVVVVFWRSPNFVVVAVVVAVVVVVVFRSGQEQSRIRYLPLFTQQFAFVQVALIDWLRNQIVALLLFKLSFCQLQKILGESGVGHQR